MSTLKDQLQKVVTGEVTDDPHLLELFSHDASIFEVQPQVIVSPNDSTDIQALVKFVNKNPHLSLTPRSAGTDMSGGAVNDSIILDMTHHFNQIIDINEDSAVVEPGVYYRDFEKATLMHNLLLPCYPASRELCTVGGMVANNSSGEKTLTFGSTKNFVKELKVILADGHEYLFKPLTLSELELKLEQSDFEGEVYRKTYQLIRQNWELIQSAKPQTSKNSSGYFLWDVWDGKTFDLTKLITGSQGTLGIVTEIEFKLIQPKPYENLLVIFLYNLDPLSKIVERVMSHQPESFESYDDKTIQFATRFLPEVLKVIHPKNIIKLMFDFIPEALMTLQHGFPKLVLLAEFTAKTPEEALQKALHAQADLADFKLTTRVTRDEDESKKYWTIRRESFNLFRHHAGDKQTVPFIDDIIVNPSYYGQFLPELNQLLAPYKNDMVYTIAGHIGNGNFHIIPLMDLKNPRTEQVILELTPKVHELVKKYQGSFTAEHNDGLVRGPYLKMQYGEQMYQLFKEVKQIFDPNNIFNPHKKIDATFDYSYKHLKKQ